MENKRLVSVRIISGEEFKMYMRKLRQMSSDFKDATQDLQTAEPNLTSMEAITKKIENLKKQINTFMDDPTDTDPAGNAQASETE